MAGGAELEQLTHELQSPERVSLEVLTVGRVGVDLYAEQLRVPIREVRSFAKSIGGSPTNVAVAAARLGQPSAVLTKVGDDELGAYVRSRARGVRRRHRGSSAALRRCARSVVIARDGDPRSRGSSSYREPKAPDMEIRVETSTSGRARRARVLDQRRSLADEPSRSDGADAAARARPSRAHGARPRLPPVVLALRGRGARDDRRRGRRATVAVGNRVECEIAVGESDPDAAADALLARGVEVAFVKQGGDGVLVATADERRLSRRFPSGRRVRARRGRRVRGCALSRAARRLETFTAASSPMRGRARRIAAPVRGRDADRGRGRAMLEESRAQR
jgi:5-dehydro-2-deoxygluconokinase